MQILVTLPVVQQFPQKNLNMLTEGHPSAANLKFFLRELPALLNQENLSVLEEIL